MPPHNTPFQFYQSPLEQQPHKTAAGTLTIDRMFGVIPVDTTVGAAALTLAVPTKAGIVGAVVLDTDNGDLTLTVTNGYNADADTDIVFDDAGDFVVFYSIDVAGTKYWRVLGQEGTNAALEDFAVDQLTATTATITTVNATNVDAGASGAVGSIDVFPATAAKGKFILTCTNQDGATNVTLKPAAMAQACVVSIPDPGAATANVMLTDQANDGAPITATSAELNVLDGVTAGTVLASGGVVVDASKDVGDFRNLDCQNLDAGADASVGTVDIFPTTTSKGKFTLSCDDQDGDTAVELKPAPMAQACVVSIPDPGAATINVMLTDQANDGAPITATSAELNVLDGVTAGTVLASGGVVVDSNKDIGDFRNLDAVNIDAGADAAVGSVDIFPTTTSRGKFILTCTDQDGATNVTFKPAAMGQASVVSIPDPGAATANVLLTDAANDGVVVTATADELNQLDGNILDDMAVTAGVGITGTADNYASKVEKIGTLFKTTIVIDIDGLNCGGANDDVIGADGAGVAHLGQITAARSGTIFAGTLTCIEAPTGGDEDIDLHSATEATGVEDTAIADLTETKLCNSGNLTAGSVIPLTAFPAANEYLYLTCGTFTDATYTAGILVIELWGK